VDAPHHLVDRMTPVLVGGAWAALVVWGGWRGWVDRLIRERLALGRPALAPRRLSPRMRRLIVPVAVGAALLPLAAWAAPVAAAMAWGFDAHRRRRAVRHQESAVVDGLPEVVDLLRLAAASGMTVPLAIATVGERAVGPVAGSLRDVAYEVGMGRRCADALEDVPGVLGESVRPLVAALIASDRHGAPLSESLGRLAEEVRRLRQRRAQEAAGRIPIKLLFPLVCCVLPAFGLLTVAPLLAGALRSLRL
jgi:tight adherence protein C